MTGRSYKAALIATAVVLLVLVSLFQKSLNRERANPQLGLTRGVGLGSNAPPVLAFTTVALGGFRGLIANALWIRANDLQQDGKYFEMVQLADWITKMEPTLTQVWLVQAWNMAYNISVKFPNPYDRWRWVQRGIELLRDDGLRYNPREALMYRELAWFFQHKMGQNLDDAHMIYKQEWAKAMEDLLGSGRPDYKELLNPTSEASRARVEKLKNQYKMDPQRMKEVDDQFGPLEWRLPEAHAIYWASVGLSESKKADLITLRRVIYQSMHVMVLRGRLISIDPLRFGPDLAKADQANAAYEQMIRDDTEQKDAIRRAHRNYLKELIFLLYSYNRMADARRWYDYVRETYPGAIQEQNLDQYALKRIAGEFTGMTYDRAKTIIDGLLSQYLLSLASDEDDRAAGFELMARKLWSNYADATKGQEKRLSMAPLDEMKVTVLNDFLNPTNGLPPEAAARLRTKLNLPPPSANVKK
jgi:hypothetical protein